MRPLRATFLAFGFFWGTWAVVALDVQRFLEFSDAQLGLLLAATAFSGVLANGAGGVIAERHGTRTVLASALVVWGVLLAVLAATTNRSVFCVTFLLTVSGGGLVDVTMNLSAATAALGSMPGRLLRLHALFNCGALLGAGTSGLLLAHDVSYRVIWAGVSAAAIVLALWCRSADMPAGERGEHHTVRQGLAALKAEGLGAVAIVFAIGALVEGGVGTWGVLFLLTFSLAVAASRLRM